MSLFNIFNIAGSGMNAQSARLNVVASNLANAESTTSENGRAYRAKQVELMASSIGKDKAYGVKVSKVVEDKSPYKMLYNPTHPHADANGYVAMPNVDVAEEMVNMMSASRAYQNNVDAMNMAKTLLIKTLSLGQ